MGRDVGFGVCERVQPQHVILFVYRLSRIGKALRAMYNVRHVLALLSRLEMSSVFDGLASTTANVVENQMVDIQCQDCYR